ncbi:MAG: FHA domain-containing protein [Solirubrobacterales bacterium]
MVIREGAGAGSEHPVDGELILGREHGSADLVIDDPGVSRRHARVLNDAGVVVVEDLGSSNGTYVNGERIAEPVEVAAGDELQLGGTVLGVEGGTSATALMPPGAPPTEQHPGPAQRPERWSAPPRAPSARPAPRRLAPPPSDRGNLPALAALFLGPLSIALVFLSAGGFFIALPCGIAAVVLGSIGMTNVDRGKASAHRGWARIGRFTGIIGTFLAVLAVIIFVVVATALHATESSVGGLAKRIRDEINNVHVPKAPDVKTSSPSSSSGGTSSGGGGSSGGTATPGE